MNAPFSNNQPLEIIDAMLMDIARRIQLTPTKHAEAEQHFRALCQHVDRLGSPLEGKVVECYPGGSFATGTAILSKVSSYQHDVDVVMELDLPNGTSPKRALQLLFDAINGQPGSRYHGCVTLNSRCVTVVYDDNTTVDLMPIVRVAGPERAGNLFHSKPEKREEYLKPVNPWGFAHLFNAQTEIVEEFAKAFATRAHLGEFLVEKADTQPLPDHVPLSEKSPRVVALQLAKRARDISYRRRSETLRRPPSIIQAALSLEMGPLQPRLVDELIALLKHMAERIGTEISAGRLLEVRNPAYDLDLFTDRWPENAEAQKIYCEDLRRAVVALYRLRNDDLSPEQMKEELEKLFGETAATYAVEGYLEDRQRESSSGRLKYSTAGKILTGTAAISSVGKVARASTFQGGGKLPS